MTIQDIINQLHSHQEARTKNKNGIYERLIHNNLVQDLIKELSEDLDE